MTKQCDDVGAAGASRRNKRRKVTALLAGGLVLGVGAVVTLASWNDSEFATGGTFGAGSFTFQGSPDDMTFSDHSSVGTAANLTFSAGVGDLSPGDIVYAPYALRVTDADADLTHVPPIVSGALNGDLTFDSRATPTFGCDATAFGNGTPVPPTIADGSTVNLCLRVTAGQNIGQGDTGTVVWQWDAESL